MQLAGSTNNCHSDCMLTKALSSKHPVILITNILWN